MSIMNSKEIKARDRGRKQGYNMAIDELFYMPNEKSQYINIDNEVETVILWSDLEHIVKQLKSKLTN